jgi:Cytochrome c
MPFAIKKTAWALSLSVIFIACTRSENPASGLVAAAITPDSLIKRGEYLVNTMGCNDCHSPKVFGPQGPYPDPDRLLSGHPAAMPLGPVDTTALRDWVLFNMHNTAAIGPWGVSYAANLTSDPTGIGNWTLDQFKKALREGKYKGLDGARMLLPPMPWPNFTKLSDADTEAIFAYLKSTTPVNNLVPTPSSLAELSAGK